MRRLMVLAALAVTVAALADNGEMSAAARSPNGRNEIRFDAESMTYEIRRDGQVLVTPSRIGLKLDGRCLGCEAPKPRFSTEKLAGTRPTPIYRKAAVDLAGEKLTADFGDWSLEFVARNDGVAYRFVTRLAGEVRVDDERFTIAMGDPGTRAYVNSYHDGWRKDPFQNSWEAEGEILTVGTISNSERSVTYLPMVFRYSDGTAMCVNEANLFDYPGASFRRSGTAELQAVFGRFPTLVRSADWGSRDEDLFDLSERLRYRRILERADYLVDRTPGTREYPWRVFMLAPSMARLAECDLMAALARPAEGDFSWVKPGLVAWDWWNCFDNLGIEQGCTTAGYRRFIDFASSNSIPYVIVDEGWSEQLDIWKLSKRVNLAALIPYARERNVGLIPWMPWAQCYGQEEQVVEHFAKLGVVGFKVDYIDRDDAQVVRFIERMAKVCAKHRLLLAYHGMYKPTGVEFTYPNVLSFEGIRGLEVMKYMPRDIDFTYTDISACFVRLSAGPADYTPGAMDNYPLGAYDMPDELHPGSSGTRCHQLALSTVYFSPITMLCDSPTNYERELESFRYLASVPTVWDDTVSLGGECARDGWFAVARRSGDTWYAAGINGVEARPGFAIETKFLGTGEWQAEIFHDGPNAATKAREYLHLTKGLLAGEKLVLPMAPVGGFVVRFTRRAK